MDRQPLDLDQFVIPADQLLAIDESELPAIDERELLAPADLGHLWADPERAEPSP